MGQMSSGSWASYQAALPIEARAGGEPDDDDRDAGPSGPPSLAVMWFQPVEFEDVETREIGTHDAPVTRSFVGPYRVAERAAMRFVRYAARKHGGAWLQEFYDNGDLFESYYGPDGLTNLERNRAESREANRA